VAAGFTGASLAQARPGQQVTFEAPAQLGDASARPAVLDQLESLGVKAVRVSVSWAGAAPDSSSTVRPSVDLKDPANYNWDRAAGEISDIRARGMKVLLTIAGPAPRWGTQGALDNITKPRASDFKNFTEAIAKQFGGQVSMWSIWNEPNFRTFLLPQLVKKKPASPAIYRQLYLAAESGFKAAGQSKAKMLIGETAPRAGADGVGPLAFLRGVLCLDSKYKPIKKMKCAKLTTYGWAHHPYAPAAGPFFVPPRKDDVTIGSLSRLSTALSKAVKAKALSSGGNRIFLTEFGVQSYPDKLAGVSLPRQSDYRSISERTAWLNPHVYGFSQYLMADDKIGTSASQQANYSGFQSGLETTDGKKKPSYDGFRLPLVATPVGKSITLWGLVRPATGKTKVTLLRADKGSSKFKSFGTVHTKADGSWQIKTSNASKRRWEVQWKAPDGTTYTGSATSAYKKK
jgi:hypothetical protein